jgi:predicted acetyltransferase
MTTQFQYGTASTLEDLQQYAQILTQCFNSPPSAESTYLKRSGQENVRVLRQAGRIVGGLVIFPMGQWYGGKCVSMAGIGGVAIAPEARGAGAAIALMQAALQEIQERDMALSVLYPATQRLYRKAGYEQGGFFCKWQLPTPEIQIKDYSLSIQPVALETQSFAALYQQHASQINGYISRHSSLWESLLEQKEDIGTFAYSIGPADQPQGYLIFEQRKDREGGYIAIRDWVLQTPAAVKRFWTFLADHRSQIDRIQWRSSPLDALTLVLPEQSATALSLDRWMLRIVDVSRALEERGYPHQAEAELHLAIEDHLLTNNHGKFVLTVANGKGSVTPGGRGDLLLNVSSLSPLYTNLFTPQQLQRMGHLDAPEPVLAIANQIFAGPSPWMPDFF